MRRLYAESLIHGNISPEVRGPLLLYATLTSLGRQRDPGNARSRFTRPALS